MPQPIPLPYSLEEFVVRVIAADGAQGSWRGTEDVDFVLFEDSPEGSGVGCPDWLTFEEYSCRAS